MKKLLIALSFVATTLQAQTFESAWGQPVTKPELMALLIFADRLCNLKTILMKN